jgi:kynurenine 3-monooxygenase
MASSKRQKTVVVGAGPVGSLAALYAATRGHDVEIYELRGGARIRLLRWLDVNDSLDLRDPSVTPLNFTKSINLALSERGINSMRLANRPLLLDLVLNRTIPMHGRMIHGEQDGTLYEQSQAYDVHRRVGSFVILL